MPGKGNYLETLYIRQLFKGAQTWPSSGFMSLHASTLLDNADGSEISTVGTGYNRVAYAPTSANWASLAAPSSVANSTTFNKAAISFSSALSSYTINAVGYWDSSAAGNLLYLSSVAVKVIEVGDIPIISSADLRVSEE